MQSVKGWLARAFRRLSSPLIEGIYPPACVACEELLEENESVFCSDCRLVYEEAKARECSRCFHPRSRCLCSKRPLEAMRIPRLVKLYTYRAGQVDLPQNRLIYALKHHHRRDVRSLLSDELTNAIVAGIPNVGGFVITHAPRSQRAIFLDGYDHIEELAETMADMLGIPFVRAISRKPGGRVQKELSSEERKRNMLGRFYASENVNLHGKSVFVVDDVTTSGATLTEAGRILYEMGAATVVGVVISTTGKDSRDKPKKYSIQYKTMR